MIHMNDAMSLHSQVMGNYVRLKASKSAIRGHLTKQIICRKITLKSDSDHGYLMLTDTDSIDAFLLSKLFEKIYLRIIKIELNIFQHFRSLVSCFRYSYIQETLHIIEERLQTTPDTWTRIILVRHYGHSLMMTDATLLPAQPPPASALDWLLSSDWWSCCHTLGPHWSGDHCLAATGIWTHVACA